jgi:chemotaxis protein CheZ
MAATALDRDLDQQLQSLRQQRGDLVKVEDVGEVVRSLLTTLTGEVSTADLKLYQEVEALSDYIHRAKAELAQLRPHDIQSRYIASATDELDAIVGATENATNTILDTAERLEEMSRELTPEQAQRLTEATTTIFEACNFQDITGQRITKVVRALKHIEERIESLVSAFGPDMAARAVEEAEETAAAEQKRPTDEDLLNGPQMPEKAHDQAAIDALFNNG